MDKLYGDLGKAIAGQKFGLHDETETLVAGENIYPGDPVFQNVGDEEVGYGAHISGVTLTASAALVAGNNVALTINGVSLEVAFSESSPETFRKIVDAINLSEDLRGIGITAFQVEGNPLKFSLSGPGVTITGTATVTGGASQATFSSATYTAARFRGVARHMELSYREGTGFYPAGVAVNVLTQGQITVPVADAANPDNLKPAYVILTGANAGKFTDESSGNYDCGCYFRSARIEGNLALIEVRGLK
ncbi:MAG: hypothetical protein LBD55_02545 [Treponema sp.]|jgi:hypothetical protein|nr:hypothetical protein [Treponema sp.]